MRLPASLALSSISSLAALAALAGALCLGCSSSSSPSSAPSGVPGTVPAFDLHADLTQAANYWSFPSPSDLRLNAQGAPDERGFPNPLQAATIRDLGADAESRKGFPQLPVAYFTMSAPIAPRKYTDVLPAEKSSPVLLVDVDPSSSERGSCFPSSPTLRSRIATRPTTCWRWRRGPASCCIPGASTRSC